MDFESGKGRMLFRDAAAIWLESRKGEICIPAWRDAGILKLASVGDLGEFVLTAEPE